MNKKILAVFMAVVLATGLLGAATVSAQAQTSSESKVLKTILGLTESAKRLIGQIIPTVGTIKEDLEFKKKFYQFEPFEVQGVSFIELAVANCPLNDPSACAFNVESIQLNGDGASVIGIIVDGAFTDLSNAPISTPTNLLVDTDFGKIGASEFVVVQFDGPYSGEVEWNGEKPQAMELCTFPGGPNPCIVGE